MAKTIIITLLALVAMSAGAQDRLIRPPTPLVTSPSGCLARGCLIRVPR